MQRPWKAAAVVVLAVVLGGAARLGTTDWGLPYSLHVDEKGFVLWEALGMEYRGLTQEDWRPRLNTYGPLLLETAIGMKWWWMGGRDHAARVAARYPDEAQYIFRAFGPPGTTDYSTPKLLLLLRTISALFGTLTIMLLALAAFHLRGMRAAAFTAVIVASAVGLIQVSHFYTAEALLVPEIAMYLHACALLSRRSAKGSLAALAYAGVALGLMASTKMPGLMLLPVLPISLAAADPFPTGSSRHEELGRMAGKAAHALFSLRFLLAILVALSIYRLLCPWAFTEADAYFSQPSRARDAWTVLLSNYTEREYGFYDWRFTYNGTQPFIYHFTHVLPYALGTPALLAALFGLFRGTIRLEPSDRIVLFASVPILLLVGTWGVKTIRYVVPALPALSLAAGLLLAQFTRSTSGPRRHKGLIRRFLAWGVAIATVAYGLAFTLMFAEPDPRIQAGRFIAKHALPGDVVVVEPEASYTAPLGTHDENVGIDPEVRPAVHIRRLWAGRPTDPQIDEHLRQTLAGARFLIVGDFYLRRAFHPEAPRRAPKHHAFYRSLLSGRTAFRRVAVFRPEPTLGPWSYSEEGAEILSTSFDHMGIEVWERRAEAPEEDPNQR